MQQRILRLPEVLALTGLSRSKIYSAVAENAFPRPLPLGPRAVGWLEREISLWIDARVAARDADEAEVANEQ